jgi:hypothetical protein
MALEGDTTALRLCLERIAPPRKDAPVCFAFLDAEGIDYATAASDTSEDITDLVIRARPYISLLLCMR